MSRTEARGFGRGVMIHSVANGCSLRLWTSLRFAVAVRRQEREVARAARNPKHNPYAQLNEHFAGIPADAPVNEPYPCPELEKPR